MDYLWEERYPDPEMRVWQKYYAIKKFGVNLATHILRQPESTAYFRKYPVAEKKLQQLQEKVKEQMNWVKEHALNKLAKK